MIYPKPKPQKSQKKKKMGVKKVSSRGKLKKAAHAILREIVILRDRECVCPAPKNGHSSILQAGHLIPGTKGGTYFSLKCVNLQCQACNGRHVYYPHYYTNWFVTEFGQKEYDLLCSEAENPGLKSYELEEMIEQLTLIRDRQLVDSNFVPRFTQQEILSGKWGLRGNEDFYKFMTTSWSAK